MRVSTGGRPAGVERRAIVNAVLYLGTPSDHHDFRCHQTVYSYFRHWRDNGAWQQIHDALLVQVRVAVGRDSRPSAAILDSQRVKTTENRG
jgi:transposase